MSIGVPELIIVAVVLALLCVPTALLAGLVVLIVRRSRKSNLDDPS